MLAETIVGSILAPLLKKGGEKAFEALGESLGKDAADVAREVPLRAWRLVSSAFSAEDELTTLKLFARSPDLYQTPVEQILSRKMEHDAGLRNDVYALVHAWQPQPSTSVKIEITQSPIRSSYVIGQINH